MNKKAPRRRPPNQPWSRKSNDHFQMYRLAFETLRKTYPLLLVLWAVFFVSTFFDSVLIVAAYLLVPPLIYQSLFRAVLLEDRIGWTTIFTIWFRIPFRQHLAFWWRFLAIYLGVLVCLTLVSGAAINWATSQTPQNAAFIVGLATVVATVLAYSGLLARFGTALVAVSIGSKSSYALTRRRARLTFWRTWAALIFGPFLFYTAFLALSPEMNLQRLVSSEYVVYGFFCGLWVLVNLLVAAAIAKAYQNASMQLEHDDLVDVF